MIDRELFIDAVGMMDDDILREHITKKAPAKAARIRKYILAVAIYAAAILLVAGLIPFIIMQEKNLIPNSGNDPVMIETAETAVTVATDVPICDTESEPRSEANTSFATDQESEIVSSEETYPVVTESVPAGIENTTVTVHEPPADPDLVIKAPLVLQTDTSANTTKAEPVQTDEVLTEYVPVYTTSKPYEPYPAPHIFDTRLNSVTMLLYGCEYTLSLDKDIYKSGDPMTLTVTLENKGQTKLSFSDEIKRKTFLDDIYVYAPPFMHSAEFEEGNTKRRTLLPGDRWTYSVTFDTTEWDSGSSWKITGTLKFYVNGTFHSEKLNFAVCHEGMRNISGIYNPFTGSAYNGYFFKGNGEIVINMNHDTTLNWEDYLNEEYLGFELERVTSWSSKEADIRNHEASDLYSATISIFLEDKGYEATISAMSRLYELDREFDFMNTAEPLYSGAETPVS